MPSTPRRATVEDAYEPHIDVDVQPPRLTSGGIAVVTAEVAVTASMASADEPRWYAANWVVEGPVRLSEEDTRIALLGATTVTGGRVDLSKHPTTIRPPPAPTPIRATLDTSPLSVGSWRVGLELTEVLEDSEAGAEPRVISGVSDPFEV